MEAQSQGLAVLSTNLSGVPELINHEINGLLVAPDDTVALINALMRLITNPTLRDKLGSAGREIVANRFDRLRNFQPLYKLIIDACHQK